jgi:hypothetical protein
MTESSIDGGCYRSRCRLSSYSHGLIKAAITTIDLVGMTIDSDTALDESEELDAVIFLEGSLPLQFHAIVVGSGRYGLKVKWMPVDSYETSRLSNLLASFGKLYEHCSQTRNESIPQYPGNYRRGKQCGTGVVSRDPSRGTLDDFLAENAVSVNSPPVVDADSAGGNLRRHRIVNRIRSTRRGIEDDPWSEVISPFSGDIPDVGSKPGPPEDAAKGCDSTSSSLVAQKYQHALLEHGVDLNAGSREKVATVSGLEIAENDSRKVLPPQTQHGVSELVISHDGRMDIEATIRRDVESVQTAELAARQNHVRVLSMKTIKALVTFAMEDSSRKEVESGSKNENNELLERTVQEFRDRVASFETERVAADVRIRSMSEELDIQRSRSTESAHISAVPESDPGIGNGIGAIEVIINRLLRNSVVDGHVMPTFEDDFRKVINAVLGRERKRIHEEGASSQEDNFRLLENKITRLSATLEETERQRDEMREWIRCVESQNGVTRNVFITGMKESDPNRVMKLALMNQIMSINRGIRNELGNYRSGSASRSSKESAKVVIPEAVESFEKSNEMIAN